MKYFIKITKPLRLIKTSQHNTMDPFMITSNQSYGLQLNELKMATDILGVNNKNENENQFTNETPDLTFLYTRESDRIGEGVPLSGYPLAKQFRKKINETRKQITCEGEKGNTCKSTIRSHDQVKAILDEYNHAPKEQSPLYTTTANVIGMKAPSVATYTAESHQRSQQFSKSYNRMMFRDHGLNY